ncbi:WG repeat-containing protein [Maribacter sp. 2308TA10-17]|uniref:WG repeat-containing protein n=1 Tax=Maribacter sp. 2308TA10-17 TaxID=3386276 RepID=UPI0039BD25C5
MKKNIWIVLLLFFPLIAISQLTEIDEIAPFSEELAAVRKGNQWGFIDKDGVLVIDFRDDLVWNAEADTSAYGIKGIRQPSFQNGRCMVKTIIEDIPVYGFIDTMGKLVVEHKFLNVNPFDDKYTTGIIYEKVFQGKNEIKLDVYKYKFHEVVMDTSGEIHEYLLQPENIQMRKSRYELPWLRSKLIAKNLIAIRGNDNQLEIHKLDL